MALSDYPGGEHATLENVWRAFAVLFFLWLLRYMQDRQARIQRAAGLQIHAAKKFKERNIKRQLMHEMMTKEDKYTMPGTAAHCSPGLQVWLTRCVVADVCFALLAVRDVPCCLRQMPSVACSCCH